MTPINVHNEFDFSNACTGCCTRCCSDTTPLYVNKNLEIERWNRRRANSESYKRTATRVDLIIKEMLPGQGIEKDVAYEIVSSKLNLELDKRPLTKKDLVAIINTIKKVHNSEG